LIAFDVYGLSKLTLPKKLKEISSRFCMMVSSHYFKDIYCPVVTPATIVSYQNLNEQTFQWSNTSASKITLHVYPESEAAYRSATGWKDFNIVADLEITTDIANAANEGFGYAISATDDGIVVSGTDAQVSVYGVDGQRVYCGKAGRIDATPGLYIVRVGEKSQKVVVR